MMRMLDHDRKCALRNVAMYLTPEEAEWLKSELESLLKDPKANEHFHVHSLDNSKREISFSLITPDKMKSLTRYTKIEQDVLTER
jgi:hypothetical protein